MSAGSVRNKAAARSGTTEAPWVRRLLIALALAFMVLFLLLPLAAVFAEALRKGFGAYLDGLREPEAWSAIRLTLLTAAIAVPLNLVFGVAAAWCIAKYEFKGKAFLTTLVDLPFSVSPVVAGLTYVLIFGANGWIGPWLMAHDIKIIFAVPGIVLATVFVTVPFIAREHLLKALLEDEQGMASGLIKAAGGDAATALRETDAALAKIPAVSGGGAQQTPGLDNDSVRVLDTAEQVAQKAGDSYVTVERLLLALTLGTANAAGMARSCAP